tara:strand:+ start:5277 stop:5474 length:198 start_codon:yes stop_codon:yes gene_type:complete
MSEKDKQLAEEFNNKIVELEKFLINLNNDVKNLLIDKKDLDSLSSMVTNLRKKIDNLKNTVSEEE